MKIDYNCIDVSVGEDIAASRKCSAGHDEKRRKFYRSVRHSTMPYAAAVLSPQVDVFNEFYLRFAARKISEHIMSMHPSDGRYSEVDYSLSNSCDMQ